MDIEDMKKLPLEERLVMAVVNFANSKDGRYKIEKLVGINKNIAYGECLSLRVITESGSFLAGVKIDNENTHLSINKKFLTRLFREIRTKVSGMENLAKQLNINFNTLNNWRFTTRGIPFKVLKELLELSDLNLEDVKRNLTSASNKNIYIFNQDITSWRFPNFKISQSDSLQGEVPL